MDLNELKLNESKAKSNDYKMATAEIKCIPTDNYLTDNDCVSSNSKVVFSGLGADEVFGGYARYKTAYQRGG